jgi:hypothetical protein
MGPQPRFRMGSRFAEASLTEPLACVLNGQGTQHTRVATASGRSSDPADQFTCTHVLRGHAVPAGRSRGSQRRPGPPTYGDCQILTTIANR